MTAAISLSNDSPHDHRHPPTAGAANFLGPGLASRGIAQFAGPLQTTGT